MHKYMHMFMCADINKLAHAHTHATQMHTITQKNAL